MNGMAKTYMSNVDFCFASKSASVRSRSSFAFVLETETRMPVNILYAVTQLAWLSSTFVPTSTLSSSSSSFLRRLLALFCRYASAHRRASSSRATSSRAASGAAPLVFLRARFTEVRLAPETAAVGENLPLACAVSMPSLEGRPGLGTSRVCRCLRLCGWPGGSRWPDGEELRLLLPG